MLCGSGNRFSLQQNIVNSIEAVIAPSTLLYLYDMSVVLYAMIPMCHLQ